MSLWFTCAPLTNTFTQRSKHYSEPPPHVIATLLGLRGTAVPTVPSLPKPRPLLTFHNRMKFSRSFGRSPP